MTNGIEKYGTARLVSLIVCACLLVGAAFTGSAVAQRSGKRKRNTARRSAPRVNKKTRARSQPNQPAKPGNASIGIANNAEIISPSPGVEPFAALKREAALGNVTRLRFKRTALDTKAQATAQVALRGRMLLVRVNARSIPAASQFNQQYYVLWADLPNYGQKMYIGDLPLHRVSRRGGRGNSDTAYYNKALPEGAVFGGLMLTAEPKRFVPIPSEPLNLLLIALPPKEAAEKLIATSTPATPDASGSTSGAEANKQSKAPAPQRR